MVCILNNSFNVVAVLPAASFNLDATYPPPLTIR